MPDTAPTTDRDDRAPDEAALMDEAERIEHIRRWAQTTLSALSGLTGPTAIRECAFATDALWLIAALGAEERRAEAAKAVVEAVRAWGTNPITGKSDEQWEYEQTNLEDKMLEALEAYDKALLAPPPGE